MTRRGFLARTLQLGAGLTAAGLASGVYASQVEPWWLDVVHEDVALARLPDAYAGLTIAQISDLHFGRYITAKDIDPVVDAVNALAPDVVVITGDLVSRVDRGEPDMIVQTLSRLCARDGVYAVLGNHDWWVDAPLVADALRRAGVTVLQNEHVTLGRGGRPLSLAGVDDVWRRRDDLPAALAGIPSDAATLLLAHEPDFADTVARDPRVVLQLSGHSHGGQVRVPFHGGLHFPPWARKYPMGRYRIADLTLYTNRGIGMVSIPVRLFCRPEITLFTLRPAA
jgi:predicted MPP superfamily phosphohydrolase